jgi:hypothetical protein
MEKYKEWTVDLTSMEHICFMQVGHGRKAVAAVVGVRPPCEIFAN